MMFNKKGFTLAELMTVILISGILMAVAVPNFIGARNRADTSACKANLEIINSAIKEWALDNPDAVVAGNITVDDIDSYIDDGFYSLDEPTTGRYSQGQGTDATWNTSDDVVTTITGTGSVTINDPTCSIGGDHALD